jgi:hypothetical protein
VISVHLQGLGEHLMFAATLLIMLAAPVVAYMWGRADGRDITDESWRAFAEYGGFDDEEAK